MFEKIITIYPVISDDQSNFVEQSHKMAQSESQQQIPAVAPCNACKQTKTVPSLNTVGIGVVLTVSTKRLLVTFLMC